MRKCDAHIDKHMVDLKKSLYTYYHYKIQILMFAGWIINTHCETHKYLSVANFSSIYQTKITKLLWLYIQLIMLTGTLEIVLSIRGILHQDLKFFKVYNFERLIATERITKILHWLLIESTAIQRCARFIDNSACSQLTIKLQS